VSFKGQLFGFQEPAVKLMLERQCLLVAFEMGLGKTVITLSATEELLDSGEIATAVIICPASLKYQWRHMIAKFCDDATVVLVEGTPKMRERQYSRIITEEPDYVILNYEQCVNDWLYVQKMPMDCVVLDEATAIKSFRSKRSRRIKKMKAKYRWALTGQPVENRPEEAYSIMQWVDPEVLGRFEIFDRTFISRNAFGGVQFYKNLPTFNRRLSTAMARKRRDEPDVVDQLPKVMEEIVPVSFDPAGARLYRYIVNDLLAELASAQAAYGNFSIFHHYSAQGQDDPNAARARGRIMSRLTCLRMLCDHPELLRFSATQFDKAEGSGSQYAADLNDAGLLDTLGAAPKFDATMELLGTIIEAGHKVVVFSFFKESLYRIKAAGQDWRPQLFTGELTPRERDAAKQRFAYDDSCRLFLSSDAGGIGLDLPEASYLVNYNLPWSAGKFDQRQARIIRLSSEWAAVTLTTVLMDGSIEERMHAMLTAKRAIADAIVDGRGIDAKGQLRLSLDTLSKFLSASSV
jgi:SNF2 family DNA or RNA helicase